MAQMTSSPRFKRYRDEATGRYYLHDSHTGETRWELPETEWVELKHEESGRVFWYNQKLNKSVWEKPTELAEKSKEESHSSRPNDSDACIEESESWIEYLDPATKRKFWYSPEKRKSTWTHPSINEQKLGNTSNEYKYTNHTQNSQQKSSSELKKEKKTLLKQQESKSDSGSMSSPLTLLGNRSEWKKCWDSASRHYFYYNPRSGRSQWERPSDIEDFNIDLDGDTGSSESTISREIEKKKINAITRGGSSDYKKNDQYDRTKELKKQATYSTFQSEALQSSEQSIFDVRDEVALVTEVNLHSENSILQDTPIRKREIRTSGTQNCMHDQTETLTTQSQIHKMGLTETSGSSTKQVSEGEAEVVNPKYKRDSLLNSLSFDDTNDASSSGEVESGSDTLKEVGNMSTSFLSKEPGSFIGNSSLFTFQDHTHTVEEEILCASFLFERIVITNIKNEWRRRYFWLLSDGILRCGHVTNIKREVAHIDVNDISTIQEESKNNEFSLLDSFGKRLITLRAASEAEYRAWIRSLSKVILESTCTLKDEEDTENDDLSRLLSPANQASGDLSQVFLTGLNVLPNEDPTNLESTDNHRVSPNKVPEQGSITDSTVEIPSQPQARTEDCPTATLMSSNLDTSHTQVLPVENDDQIHVTTSKTTARMKDNDLSSESSRDLANLDAAFSKNKDLLLKVLRLRQEIHDDNYRTHELKLRNLALRWGGISTLSDSNNYLRESEDMDGYAKLWHTLRAYPDVIASIGSFQRTHRARQIFAASLAASFLDPCTLPSSLCLQKVIQCSLGTAFERPLCDAVASYHKFIDFGKQLCAPLYKSSSADIEMLCDHLTDTLVNVFPRTIWSFGRPFLTSVIATTVHATINRIGNVELANAFVEAIEQGNFHILEKNLQQLYDKAPSNSTKYVIDDDDTLYIDNRHWSVFVCSRLELFALHMALYKYPYELPADVDQCLAVLGKPKPLTPTTLTHPFVLIASKIDSLDNDLKETLANCEATLVGRNQPEIAGELLQQLYLAIDESQKELPLLENTHMRITKFYSSFGTEKRLLENNISYDERFTFRTEPAMTDISTLSASNEIIQESLSTSTPPPPPPLQSITPTTPPRTKSPLTTPQDQKARYTANKQLGSRSNRSTEQQRSPPARASILPTNLRSKMHQASLSPEVAKSTRISGGAITSHKKPWI